MQFGQIDFHLQNSPALKLLRYEHCAFALGFFHSAFRDRPQLNLPEVARALGDYIQLNAAEYPNINTSPGAARYYIDQWTDDKYRFLRRYYDARSDDPIVELSYEAEQAMQWVESLDRRDFVGAQSRFLSIFESLSKLALRGERDVKEVLAKLTNERGKLDSQIKEIKLTGKVPTHDELELRELFLYVIEESRRLMTDFRLVEDIFKDLTRNVKEEKLKEDVSKGRIVGNILDAFDHLETSDQGKSFRAFWQFLMSPEKQDELKRLSAAVLQIPEIANFNAREHSRNYPSYLQSLKNQLLQAGQKVLASQSRLSREIRKLLHYDAILENQQVTREIFDFKRIWMLNRNLFSARSTHKAIDLEMGVDFHLPLERPLWRSRLETSFTHGPVETADPSSLAANFAAGFVTPPPISEAELRRRIESLLVRREKISLPEVIGAYPLLYGSYEIVTYIRIALEDSDRHHCHLGDFDFLPYESSYGAMQVQIPKVVYCQ